MALTARLRMTAAAGMTALAWASLTAGANAVTSAAAGPGVAAAGSARTTPTVGGDLSSTALSDSSSSISYGDEQDEVFTATVTGLTGGQQPTGTVDVLYKGLPLCTVTLDTAVTATESSGTCSPTGGAIGLDVGDYPLLAKYSGDTYYGISSGTGGFTVAPEMTSITLSPPGSASYGNEQTLTFAASPIPQYGAGDASGTVTIATTGASAATLCSFTFPTASTCAITATQLPAGSYAVQASYDPGTNPDFYSSSSGPVKLTITRAATTTGLTLSAATVTYGHEGTEHLKVHVKSAVPGTISGSVAIKAHWPNHTPVTVCKITLTSGAGSCTLKSTALLPGKYTLVATFLGDVDYAKSSSAGKTLTVAK